MNKQELRRADFPGTFLSVSEDLAILENFDRIGVFSAPTRRRYGDVEYVSELLAAMIGGIQDKKTTLDEFYIEYTEWNRSERKKVVGRLKKYCVR